MPLLGAGRDGPCSVLIRINEPDRNRIDY